MTTNQPNDERNRNGPARHFSRLRRSVKRYRDGRIDGDTLATAVEHFLEWDANRS